MELKDYKDCTVLCVKQSNPFVKDFEKFGKKHSCEVVKVGLSVMRDGDDPINFTDYWPTSQNEIWTSFTTKDNTVFDLNIGDKEVFGDFAVRNKSGLAAEIFSVDSNNCIDTSNSVLAKEVMIA